MKTKEKKFNPHFPYNYKDVDGYPTKELLEWIESYDPQVLPFEDFAKMLRRCWWMADWGFKLKRKRSGKRILELHTGGWSGNEDIIDALRKNIFFFPMTWRKTYAGGHYYFSIPCE